MRFSLLLASLVACSGGTLDTSDPVDTAAPVDTGGTDTGGQETGVDTSETGDTGDTEVDPDWAHCPEASAYVGDASWKGELVVTKDAVYCSLPNEARNIAGEAAAKAKMRVVAGNYTVPTVAGDYDIAFPACTIRADATAQPAMSGTGSTTCAPKTYGTSTYTYETGSQPMSSTDGRTWTFGHTVIVSGPADADPNPLTLDGLIADASTGASAVFTLYPDGTSPYDTSVMTFGPCDDPHWVVNTHHVDFEGGDITIVVDIGTDMIITAPAQLKHVYGTLDGVAFDVTDYFRLLYRPGHHHLTRDAAVIFDAPIGDACGIEVDKLDTLDSTKTAVVSTLDCALVANGSRTMTTDTLTTK